MSFQFRFQALLKVRWHERDRCQQAVAAARDVLTRLVDERTELADTRMEVLNELRSLNDADSWVPDRIVARQRHAEDLRGALEQADAAILDAENQWQACLDRLLVANQAVKALERLCELHFSEYQIGQAKISVQELDEIANQRHHFAKFQNPNPASK